MSFNPTRDIEKLEKVKDSFSLIQIGCCYDPLPDEKGFINLVSELASLNKDISFSTKSRISDEIIGELKDISYTMRKKGRFLVPSVSIIATDSSIILEPNAPSPYERFETVRKLHQSGLHPIVNIRPVLPVTEEHQEIIDRTRGFASAYMTGPLYFPDTNKRRYSRFTAMLKRGSHSEAYLVMGVPNPFPKSQRVISGPPFNKHLGTLTITPLLPVPIDNYKELKFDDVGLCLANPVITDSETNSCVSRRKMNWAVDTETDWPIYENPARVREIVRYAELHGLRVFDSSVDAINYVKGLYGN